MSEFFDKITRQFPAEFSPYLRYRNAGYSSAARFDGFKELIELAQPKVALEIGTRHGISAGFIAQYADKVHTIDIRPREIRNEIWEFLGLKDKIASYHIKDNAEKKQIIDSLEFDFVFIDGSHTYEEVKYDFECVKDKCKKILFHDYEPDWAGVTKCVDEIQGWDKKLGDMCAYLTRS